MYICCFQTFLDDFPALLQEALTPFIPTAVCQTLTLIQPVTEDMICAGGRGDIDNCHVRLQLSFSMHVGWG